VFGTTQQAADQTGDQGEHAAPHQHFGQNER